MADIRIKDLATTATTTASDDFMAVDGSTNGTRKMNAAAPAFLTSVTTPSLTAPASTDLTLAGGSSGASLVLGQGTTGAVAIAATSSGLRGLLIGSASAADNFPLRINYAVNAGATVDFTNTTAGTSALVRLQLVSSAGTTGLTAHSATHSAWAGATLLTAPGTGGLVLLTSNATGPIDFWTFNTQVGRFTSTGNLLIGTTVETGLTGAGGLKINSSTAGSASAGALVVTGGLSAGGASYFGGAVTVASTISSTGKTTVTSGNIRLSNAYYLSGNLAAGTEITMIGRRSDDKIAIDPDGYGVVFGGGAATFAGAVTVVGATTGTSTFDYSVNNNSVQAYTIQNNSTGVSAATRFSIVAGSSAGSIQLYGSGHTTPNIMQYASPSSHKFICNGVSRLDLDVSGNATFAGTVIAPAATASLAPLRIPHGTAPTSPTDGDMWTTTAGLYIRINGATVGPLS